MQCPFHGPIIARDEQGQPSSASSSGETSSTAAAHTSAATVMSSAMSESDYNDIEAAVFAAKGKVIVRALVYGVIIYSCPIQGLN